MIPGDGLMNGTSDSFDILYPMVYNIPNTIDNDTLSKSCDYTQLEKHRMNMDVKKTSQRKFDPTSLRDATQRKARSRLARLLRFSYEHKLNFICVMWQFFSMSRICNEKCSKPKIFLASLSKLLCFSFIL